MPKKPTQTPATPPAEVSTAAATVQEDQNFFKDVPTSEAEETKPEVVSVPANKNFYDGIPRSNKPSDVKTGKNQPAEREAKSPAGKLDYTGINPPPHRKHTPNLVKVFAAYGVEILTEDERKNLRSLQEQMSKLRHEENSRHESHIKKEIQDLRKKVDEHPTAENHRALGHAIHAQGEEERKAKQVRQAIRNSLQKLTQEKLRPLVYPILDRAAEKSLEIAAEIAKDQKRVSDILDIPYEKSAEVEALEKTADFLKHGRLLMFGSVHGTTPKEALHHIAEF